LRGTGLERITRLKKHLAAALSRRFCSRMSSSAPVFVDRPPREIWLAAQRHEHLVKVPCAATSELRN
jgi:hypothetical protein